MQHFFLSILFFTALASCKKDSDSTPATSVTVSGETSNLDFLGGDYSSGAYAINNSTQSLENDAYCIVYFNNTSGLPSSGEHPVSANLYNSGDSVWINVANTAGKRYHSLQGGTVNVTKSGDKVTASFSNLSFFYFLNSSERIKASATVSNK